MMGKVGGPNIYLVLFSADNDMCDTGGKVFRTVTNTQELDDKNHKDCDARDPDVLSCPFGAYLLQHDGVSNGLR